jgi:ubiquinone/menaquinone biosynthesis C-methylase UbiE
MPFAWPPAFQRIPEGDEWLAHPVEELAKKYDTVEQHGWYENLEPTLEELAGAVKNDSVVVDYSGGTGILVDRFMRKYPQLDCGFVIVDASPKFLRLALEKLGRHERVAFRWLRYLKEERRLLRVDEVLDASLVGHGIDALVSTNAIHLYYHLDDTLRAWTRVVRPGGAVLVQSGNIKNPVMPPGHWIIDDTVEAVQEHARALVADEPRFEPFASSLGDEGRMRAYTQLRQKVFVPVRPLDHYTAALERAGLHVDAVRTRSFEAQVDEWYEFLSAYHEGVLGWAGGCAKVDGREPPAELVALRQDLLRASLLRLFEGRTSFRACWTYLSCSL